MLWLDHLLRDLRHAWRSLGRNPGFTLPAAVTLAFGIGINAAAFTLLNALALRELPVPEPHRVVSVYQRFHGVSTRLVQGSPYWLSYPEYLAYRDGSRAFAGLAAFAGVDLALGGGDALLVRAVLATCDYFRVTGARIALGRPFAPDECARAGAAPIAVVSDGFWRRRLGADPTILGRRVALGGQAFTVIGVAEPGFAGTELRPAEVWLPVSMQRAVLPERDLLALSDASWLAVLGRLRPGATPEQARADLAAIARRADADHPGRETEVIVQRGARMNSPEERSVGAALAAGVFLFAGLVLALACANVMNLLLARGAARQREIGVRLSIGASRGRLAAQLLTESALLALLGGAAGLALARVLPPLLLAAFAAPGTALDLAPDGGVLACALAVSLLSALAFGLVPARHAGRLDLTAMLQGGEGTGTGRPGRLRGLLVGIQVAGCLVLLAMAGLLARGLWRAQTVDAGFAPSGVAVLSPGVREAGYPAARSAELYREIGERARTLPGVEAVALAASLPLVSRSTAPVLAEGAGSGGAEVSAGFNIVSGSYFAVMGIPVLRGRAFRDGETAGDATPAVASEALARRLWPGGEALGRRFRSGSATYQVVGVARDARNVSLATPDGPFFYAAADPGDPEGLRLLVRTRGDAAGTAAGLARIARGLDRGVVITAEPLSASLAAVLRPARVAALATGVLGALATLVAAVGVYGVVSYGVSRRTREIGVRVALGAQPRDVLTLVTRDGARAVLTGAAVGLALAAGAARLVRGLLFGLSPLDPPAYLGVLALVLLAASLGLYRPARRAARIDPALALRGD